MVVGCGGAGVAGSAGDARQAHELILVLFDLAREDIESAADKCTVNGVQVQVE
jgi:hypothetical protein